MTDEANVDLYAMVDQLVEGLLKFLPPRFSQW